MAALLHTDAAPHAPAAPARIETARLRLRPFTAKDLDALHGMTGDPEVMRYIGERRPLSRDETRRALESMVAAFRRRGFGRWALEKRDGGGFAGYCGFSTVNEEVGVELAYMLPRGEWGRGLALEAARACLRYGFETLGLESVAGLTIRDNRRSRRVLERVGMSYRHDARFYGFDCVMYSVTRAEWRDDGSHFRVVP